MMVSLGEGGEGGMKIMFIQRERHWDEKYCNTVNTEIIVLFTASYTS
jgi:hypothetical protein